MPPEMYGYVLAKQVDTVPFNVVTVGMLQFKEDFQGIYDALRGRVNLEKPVQIFQKVRRRPNPRGFGGDSEGFRSSGPCDFLTMF